MKPKNDRQRRAMWAHMNAGLQYTPCNRTVKEVVDGDTLRVNRKVGLENRVRLAGVHAPETWQPGGRQATNTLKTMVRGKKVRITPVATDTYGRTVAKITQNRRNINNKMRDKGY